MCNMTRRIYMYYVIPALGWDFGKFPVMKSPCDDALCTWSHTVSPIEMLSQASNSRKFMV